MPPRSAGILLYRRPPDAAVTVLLVHPGGPFWRQRWSGAWQLPKGQINIDEEPVQAALREFEEELGLRPGGVPVRLGVVRQAGGKIVEAFALEGDFNVSAITSVEFSIEWPPSSGRQQSFPEVDAARWFDMAEARANILASQAPLLDQLAGLLALSPCQKN